MSLNLQIGHFYQNRLKETYVVVSQIKEGYAGYQIGFRFWVVKLHDHAPQLEAVTASGYFDVINLDVTEKDLIQEVIFQ